MRLGVCYNIDYRPDVHGTPAQYLENILQQVERLDELGYDSVWFSEHHCGAYSFGNPAVIGAAAASRTKRIRIGTGVSLVPLHHPIFLAEQYGLLDVLSGGRLEYGIGRGYLSQEYEWLKIPMSESHGRYREAMEFVLQAWQSGGSPMSFHGEYFDVDNYTYFPAPLQRPFPPIYASGGGTLDSFRWAGEKGFNLGTALFFPDRDFIRSNISLYRQSLADAGYDPYSREVCVITQMYCAKTHEEAVRDGGEFANNYYRFFSALSKQGGHPPAGDFYSTADAREMNKGDFVLLGEPSSLVERITRVADDLEFDFLLMEIAQGGASHAKIMNTIELFGTEVLPHLQKHKIRAARAA